MLVNRQYKEEFCKSSDLVPIARCCRTHRSAQRLRWSEFYPKKIPSQAMSSPALWQGNFPLCCQQARRPDISGLQVPAAPHGTLALSVASDNQSMFETYQNPPLRQVANWSRWEVLFGCLGYATHPGSFECGSHVHLLTLRGVLLTLDVSSSSYCLQWLAFLQRVAIKSG